jgi:hypothetical protein
MYFLAESAESHMIGWTPAELANHLLAETLEQFADKSPGLLEQLDEPQHFGVSELVPRLGGQWDSCISQR